MAAQDCTHATEPCFVSRLSSAIASTSSTHASTLAAFIVVHIGSWPSHASLYVRSVAANAAIVTAYFLSPAPPPLMEACSNCVWLPTSLELLSGRVTRLLLATDRPASAPQPQPRREFHVLHDAYLRGSRKARASWLPRKLMELRPLWASLFPELALRHEWIGYSDTDLILGNLTKGLRGALDSSLHDVLNVGRGTGAGMQAPCC